MLKEVAIIKNGGILNKFTNEKENHKKMLVITTDEQSFVLDVQNKIDLTNKTETILIYNKKTKLDILF